MLFLCRPPQPHMFANCQEIIWAIGCANGLVFAADTINYLSGAHIVTLPTRSPVCAIAALANETGKIRLHPEQ